MSAGCEREVEFARFDADASVTNPLRDLPDCDPAGIHWIRRAAGAMNDGVPRAFTDRVSERVVVPHGAGNLEHRDQYENHGNSHESEFDHRGSALTQFSAVHGQ